jgi:hypothetical protein
MSAVFTEYKRYLDTELGFEYDVKPGVKLVLRPEAWLAVRLTGRVIWHKVGKAPVITSGVRTVDEQIQAMSGLLNLSAEMYKEVYKNARDPAIMPHVEGRAGDWRFRDYEGAEETLKEINALYLAGAKSILGYKPSSLIVLERTREIVNCIHVQTPRQIPNMTQFTDYLSATFGRV